MLASHYTDIRQLHIACVILSGSLFTFRGLLHVAGVTIVNHLAMRIASWLIDTVLLVAAILLTLIVHQYPFVHAWLTIKMLLLLLYIVLGYIALKRARTRRGRVVAFIAALLAFGLILGVAVRHDPAGWLAAQPERPSMRGSQSIGAYTIRNSANAALQKVALSTITDG
jgi:uncharacterized membrane protein SirB2